MPPKLPYEHQALTNIDYWSLVTRPEISWIIVAGFIVVVVVFIRMFRISNVAIRVLMMISAFLLCGIISCRSSAPYFNSGWEFTHMMTSQYKGKTYQLTLATYTIPLDVSLFVDFVFECDLSGRICSELSKSNSSDIKTDHLSISNDRLMLDQGLREIQILPAINGTS